MRCAKVVRAYRLVTAFLAADTMRDGKIPIWSVSATIEATANVDHTELERLKVDQADGIESEVRENERPLKEGVISVS